MSFWDDIFGDGGDDPQRTLDPRFDAVMEAQKATAAEDRAFKQQQFQWATNVYNENKGITDEIVDKAMTTQDTLSANAADDRAFYNENYRPLQQRVIGDAMSLDSEDQMARNRGRAVAAVTDQFGAAAENARRQLEGYGVDPSALRYAALDSNWRMAEAATKAGAANQSDMATEAAGRAARSGAVAMGEPGANRSLQQSQLALGAGATAANTMLANTSTGANIMGTGVQWGGLENQANAGATDTLSAQNKAATDAYRAEKENQETSGLGSALGLAAGIGSKFIPGGSLFTPSAAQGGAIDPNMQGAPGGQVPATASPSGGKAIDDVPAQLNVGEFVMPADVTRWFGEKYFQGLIDKAREAKQSSGTAKPKMKQAIPTEPTYRSDARQALPMG